MAEFGIGAYQNTLRPNIATNAASSVAPADKSSSQSGASFVDTLKTAIQDSNEALKAADQASRSFATGEAKNLHDVMIAMEKADVSLRTITAVRGKIVEAYQEIMRMPV